jgi:5'-nucleotidase (lipoprotein e(P4) family)
MKRLCIALTAALLCCACTGSHTDRVNLNGVAWMQGSEEYRALTLGAYSMARENLDSALEDRTWTAFPSQVPVNSDEASALGKLPPAVILDIDETVLSTLPYQAWLVKNDRPFTRMSWNAWVSEASAEALPGALDFVHYAMEKGVTVFYLTNRAYQGALDANVDGKIDPGEEQLDLKPFTISNLERLGLLPQKDVSNDASVILRGETGSGGQPKKGWASSDKTARRESLSSDYRVVLLMGDNLDDFISYPKRQDGEGESIPDALDPYRARGGRSWILLPNPIYGSWEKRLHDSRQPLSAEERTGMKLDSLDTWQ